MKIRYGKKTDMNFLVFALEDNRNTEKRPKKDIKAKKTDIDLFKRGIKEKTIRVIEKNTEPIGFFHWIENFKLMHAYNKFVWADLVYVKKEHRNQGIGNKLWKDFLKISKSKNFHTIYLDIFESNKKSKKFHKKLGFEEKYTIYQKKI